MRILMVILLLFCMSCQYFSRKQKAMDKIVQDEIKSINWQDVDKYPLFDSCDETAPKQEQRACFETAITDHFYHSLLQQNIQVNAIVNDTIYVILIIRNDGTIGLEAIEALEDTALQIPELEAIISASLQTLPKIYPAEKRGIPVASKVKLPIVLQSN